MLIFRKKLNTNQTLYLAILCSRAALLIDGAALPHARRRCPGADLQLLAYAAVVS